MNGSERVHLACVPPNAGQHRVTEDHGHDVEVEILFPVYQRAYAPLTNLVLTIML